jgi:branched-chain amino acid transport system ATP-binding protein
MILETSGIHTYYDTAHIIQGVTIQIAQGETVCLLGRNGAGKTTFLKTIIGLTPPRRGRILFREEDIAGLDPYKIAHKGIGYAPEDREIFPTLTIRDNLQISHKSSRDQSTDWTIDKIYEKFPLLKSLEQRRGNQLSGGEQQLACIARALIGNPSLLLLDEPTKGLAPMIVKNTLDVIREIKQGITILLAEQNTKFAFAISDRAYILNKGVIEYESSVTELSKKREIQEKYLAVL